MEAESGFNYSLTKEEMHKFYIYLKIVKCSEERQHECLYNAIRYLFITIFENRQISFWGKRDMIKDMFKKLKDENKNNPKLSYIFNVFKKMII